jgi:hypothetical protein
LAATGLVACLSLPGFAQNPRDIKIAANTEIAVPGHLLEPGTYWILRLMTDMTSLYEITTNDGRFIAFVDVIPTQRADPGNTEVNVSTPDAAGVRVLQSRYGPGQIRGLEIAYPKGEIQRLDQRAELQTHGSGHLAGQQ